MPRDDCPNDQELAAMIFGDQPDEVADAIARHLESCPRCESRAQQFDDDVDPMIATLRVAVVSASETRTMSERLAITPPAALEDPRIDSLEEWKSASLEIASLESGSTLPRVPNYAVLGFIGEGGMGVVYKARHLKLDRVVALKMIAGTSSKLSERFKLEAEAVARLQSPNIVQIFEVGEYEGQPFLSLELIEGGSLESRLAGRPQSPRESAEMVRTLALAVDHAHRQGIVHRDLKPSNILFTADGVVKITDFGIAKRLESDEPFSRDGEILGTPRYMAPEQIGGTGVNRIGPATDVFSLGVILYEMLTGRVPHQSATSYETMTLVCEQEPVPPRRLQPKLPRDLETITLKCLSKEPAKRYTSARTLAEELARFLAGESILARPVGTPELAYRWARRHPTVSSLALVALLVMTAVAFGLWRYDSTLRWYNSELRVTATLAENEADRARAAEKKAEKSAQAEAEQRRQAEAALYFSRITLAKSEWSVNNVVGAISLLKQCVPKPGQSDLRGWEWRYLMRITHAELFSLGGHANWVHSLAFSRDGTWLVAGTGLAKGQSKTAHFTTPGSLHIWDTATRLPIRKLEGHSGAILSVDMSPDGQRFASAGADGLVFLWDIKTFKSLLVYKQSPRFPLMTRFAPDGRTLAVADSTSVTLINLGNQEVTQITGSGLAAMPISFSPDGKCLAVKSGLRSMDILDLPSGKVIRNLQSGEAEPKNLRYSRDGSRLGMSNANGTIIIWESQTGRIIHKIRGHDGEATCLDFSPDGKLLVSGGVDQAVRLWSLGDGLERTVYRGHTFGVRDVAFSPDSRRIASAGQEGVIKFWDVNVDPRGLSVAAGATGEWVGDLAFTNQGANLAAVLHDRGSLMNWSVAEGALAKQVKISVNKHLEFPRGDSAFSRDGRLLAVSDRKDDRLIKLYEVSTGREIRTLAAHTSSLAGLVFNADASRLASTSRDRSREDQPGEVKIWDVATGKPLATWPVDSKIQANRLSFNSEGTLIASANADGTIRLWETKGGRETLCINGHHGNVMDVTFSPDGRRLASISRDDPTVRVWDVKTGRNLLTLRGHNHSLTGLTYSPDGRLLASVGFEGLVKLWDSTTGQDILTLRPLARHRPGDYAFNARVVFSLDGTRIASNGWDGRISIWYAPEMDDETEASDFSPQASASQP